jgi:putative DNA primase/helicase
MARDIEAVYREICREVSKDPDGSTNGFCPAHHDDKGSLSVTLNDDRSKILIKCFAGCDIREIVRNLGYEMSDLFRDADRPGGVVGTPPLSSGRRRKNKTTPAPAPSHFTLARLAEIKRLPVEYLADLGVRDEQLGASQCVRIEYRDEQGKALDLGRRRFTEKASSGMRWQKGAKPTIYGLWYLPRIRELGWCILVEGESDCWTLWRHKQPALGVPGADMIDKIRPEHVRGLRKIYVFVEPDKGGETFRRRIPERLAEIGWGGDLYEVRLEGYKDPSDLHVRGGDAEFDRLWAAAIKDAENHRLELRPATPDQHVPPPGRALTDLGNAERMVRQHGGRIRWCEEWRRWLIWDQVRWAVDRECRITRLAAQTARSIYGELINANGDKNEIFKHARRSESRERINAMVDLSRSQEGVSILSERLDSHPMLLACRNGTVDLQTGKLQPTRADYYITRLAPVEYDSQAQCPRWLQFLDRIMEGDQEMVQFLQRAVGYSLTGRCTERCFFLLWGVGKNGKSTFVETIHSLLGDYALRTPTATLMAQRYEQSGSQASPDVARLKGSRFVSAAESEAGQRLSESKIKDLTGQDTISARHLFGDLFDFRPEFKLWLSTNHKPIIRGTDDAIWDRVKLIPFAVRIPPEEQDPHLGERLRVELPGILQWAIQGCLKWQDRGLQFPKKIEAAVEAYREEMDVLKEFIDDRCVIDSTTEISNSDLYKAYRKYCEERAQSVMAHRTFTQRMSERGFNQIRKHRGRIWLGIRLLLDDELDDSYYDFGQGRDTVTDSDSYVEVVPGSTPRIEGNATQASPSVTVSRSEHNEEENKIDLDQFRGGGNGGK